MQTFTVVKETESFGKVDAHLVEELRTKLHQLYPYATLFKTNEEQENEMTTCVKNLSLNTSGELSEKMNNLNVK